MENADYLIIGGGIAGTTAAEEIRRQDHKDSITIISKEPYPLYSRVMISKPSIMLGEVPLDKVFLRSDEWYKERSINLIKGREATRLDPNKKEVALDDGSIWHYQKLLLAIGTRARHWDVQGSDKDGVCYIKTLDDAKNIRDKLPNVKSVIVIGSSFTSFEICDVLTKAKLEVSEVILEPYYWYPVLDEAAAGYIEKVLSQNGVTLIHPQTVKEVLGENKVEGVILENGASIACQLIICGIGAECPTQWLAGTPLKLNKGVETDQYLKTNLDDIYAAGDAANYEDIHLKEEFQLGNWVNAQMQGKIAGFNMASKNPTPYSYVSSYSSHGFGITMSFIGNVRPKPDRVTIAGGLTEGKSEYRLFRLKGNQIAGAILINKPADVVPITKIISEEINIANFKKELKDLSFDLNTLLPA